MTRRKWLAAGMAVLVALAALVVLWARPRPSSEKVLEVIGGEGATGVAQLSLDNLDPNRGTVGLRLTAQTGGLPLPPEGATLITNVPGLGPLRLPSPDLVTESSAETVLETGDLVDYPFDHYELTVSMALVAGTEIAHDADPSELPYLPIAIIAASTLNGFEASVHGEPSEEIVDLRFAMSRPAETQVWATAMMAIFWLLAIGAAAVAMAILLGIRPFETRHLAWLTAMLFAFAAFRNTAPGNPPIGVFLDYGSFFWAFAVVVVAELSLLALYLSGSERGRPL